MGIDRADKATIRQWWADSVRQRETIADKHGVPLYFTLPGGRGRDIQLLIDDGLIRVTEANAIDSRDAEKIIAVESNMPACGELKRNFPGLLVREVKVKDLLRGDASHNFPTIDIKRQCRAVVVNLDYNGPWKASDDALIVIDKFARLHESAPGWAAIDWTLCLTFRANLVGPQEDKLSQVKFLQDQIVDDQRLLAWVENHLGDIIHDLDMHPESIESWSDEIIQRFLCILIPLKLVHLGCSMGWGVNCVRSALYGGQVDSSGNASASMVTFLIDFSRDPNVKEAPAGSSRRYRNQIAASLCRIDSSGTIHAID